MSTIPTKITQEDFDYHIRPCLSTAQRGYVSKIPLFKIFNYILYRLHTGCQWHQLPLAPDAHDPEKSEISYRSAIDQLSCRVLPFSQVEQGRKPRNSMAIEHPDHRRGVGFI